MLFFQFLIFPLSFTPTVLGVIGGTDFKAYMYPWLVSIRYRNRHHCVGYLHNDLHVVTVAHCIPKVDAELTKYLVAAREHNVHCEEGYEEIRSIKAVFHHPSYQGKAVNDIAVIQLDSPFPTGPDLNNPGQYAEDGFQFPATAVLAGWGPVGRSSKNEQPPNLYPTHANLTFVSFPDCLRLYPGKPISRFVACFGNKVTSGCMDDGAPLMCGTTVCAMFVEDAPNCGDNGKPGFFQTLGIYKAWIDSVINKNSGNGRSTTKDPAGLNVATCGGYYETTQGNIILQGLSTGQKCHFAIQTLLTEMTINLKESTMKEDDSLNIIRFCRASPCERINMLEKMNKDLKIQASLIIVSVTIGKSHTSQPRGFTMNFNSTGYPSQVPPLTGFTVLNTSTSGSYTHPTTGGKYDNNEVSLVVFDPPPEYEKYAYISIKEIDIEGDEYNEGCVYDALSVYAHEGDGYKRVTRVCGKKPPTPVKLDGGYGILSFITDVETVGEGFTFEYNYS